MLVIRNVNTISARLEFSVSAKRPSKLPTRRESEKYKSLRDYVAWKKEIQLKLNGTNGHYWLGESKPFPFNREFKPAPITREDTKLQIVKDSAYLSETELAQKYSLSIARIAAILKLSQIQNRSPRVLLDFSAKVTSILFKEGSKSHQVPDSGDGCNTSQQPMYKIIPDGVTPNPSIKCATTSNYTSKSKEITVKYKNWVFKDTSLQ